MDQLDNSQNCPIEGQINVADGSLPSLYLVP
jgi:hypothetical protein